MRWFGWLRTLLAPLRRRQYALYWVGQSCSWMGNEAYDIALVWLLIGLTGSTLLIGAVLTATYVPTLLVQWFGGIVADRVNRRLIILASDLSRLVVTAVFAALVILGRITIAEVFVFAALYGLVYGFFNPALGALVPMLIRREEYAAANAVGQVGQQIAVLAGPALGGFLIARWNVGAALAFDALTFGVAALATILMGSVRAPLGAEPEVTTEQSGEHVPDKSQKGNGTMREAVRFLRSEPGLLTMIVFFSLTNGLNNVMAVLTPVLVRQTLHLSATVYGLAATCAGVTMLVGGLVVGATMKKLAHPTVIVCGAMVLFGAGIVVMGLAMNAASLYGAYAVTFLGFITADIIMGTLWQLAIPDRLRGRVMSLVSTIAMCMNPLGFLFAGALGEAYGVRAGLWIGGGSIAVLAVLVFLLPAVRHLDARARVLLTVPASSASSSPASSR